MFWVTAFLPLFLLAGAATLIAFVAGVSLAWISAKSKSPLVRIMRLVLMLPLIFPPSIVALFLLFFTGHHILLAGLHMPPIDEWICKVAGWSVSSLPLGSLTGTLLALPIVYHISLRALRLNDGTQLDDVVRVYGVPQWRIALPFARRDLALAAVCGFVRAFAESGILVLIFFGLLFIFGRKELDLTSFYGEFCAFMSFFVILTTAISVVALMKSSCNRR